MNENTDQSSVLGLKVKAYFTDLSFYTRTVFGGGKGGWKRIWLFLAYLFFSLGMFSRQITKFPQVDLQMININWGIFVASFLIGLAIFPFILRQIVKIATWIIKGVLEDSDLPETLNLIHLFVSFSVGFFGDLFYEKIIEFIKMQLH